LVASALDRVFFDTNVLVYVHDDRDAAKQLRASALFRDTPTHQMVVSGQVLGEFYWTVTRKLPTPLSDGAAKDAVLALADFNVVPIDTQLVRDAIELATTARLAYWDALIVKAASSAGCQVLLTEDLNHGQVIDGVRVENPFL
jgi:predicted nucleic acid-binding protein